VTRRPTPTASDAREDIADPKPITVALGSEGGFQPRLLQSDRARLVASQEVLSSVEAGEVVFEEVDDAVLFVEFRPPEASLAETLARDLLESRPTRTSFEVGLRG